LHREIIIYERPAGAVMVRDRTMVAVVVVAPVISRAQVLKRDCPTEGQICDKAREGRDEKRDVEVLPSRTSQWYACQYHRTCRSSGLYEM
jgi:hypothetical protein